MWMPSVQPPGEEGVEDVTLDWESLGRAIRECVLDVLAAKVSQIAVSVEHERIDRSDPGVNPE